MPSKLHDADTIVAEAILAVIAPGVRQRLGALECVAGIDSTNAELLRRGPQQPDRGVLIADTQQAGRGRQGRVWHSPPGANLYLSLFRRFRGGVRSGLSLAVGVALAEALHTLGFGAVRLKWPNDLVALGRKLGGVLIEVTGEAAVIGVGVNVRMPSDPDIDQPWIDLAALGPPPSRNALAAALLEQLLPALDEFEAHGLDAFRARWEALDAFAAQGVALLSGAEEFDGWNLGLAPDGGLRVRLANGERVFHSAEVSLRAP